MKKLLSIQDSSGPNSLCASRSSNSFSILLLNIHPHILPIEDVVLHPNGLTVHRFLWMEIISAIFHATGTSIPFKQSLNMFARVASVIIEEFLITSISILPGPAEV